MYWGTPSCLALVKKDLFLMKLCVCVFQVWAAVPPWKQGTLSEFVVVSGNEVTCQFCAEMPLESINKDCPRSLK